MLNEFILMAPDVQFPKVVSVLPFPLIQPNDMVLIITFVISLLMHLPSHTVPASEVLVALLITKINMLDSVTVSPAWYSKLLFI